VLPVWADTDPGNLAGDPLGLGLGTSPSDADDRLESPVTYLSHAVVDPEHALLARVFIVSPLVDKRSHVPTFFLLWFLRATVNMPLAIYPTVMGRKIVKPVR
jgi:hypothetical protein